MTSSEVRGSIRKLIEFGESLMHLKKVLDEADAAEQRAEALTKNHEATVAKYQQLEADALSQCQLVKDQYTALVDEYESAKADIETEKRKLDDELKAYSVRQADDLKRLQQKAAETVAMLNAEKAEAMKAAQEAKVLHAAEMQAIQAQKAKLEHDLTKLREIRQALLAQLQTGV